jgi:hypothetical protein
MFNAVSGKSEASPHFDLASRRRVRVRFRIRPGGEEQKNDQDVLFLCCRRTFSHVQPIEFSLLSKNVSRIFRQDSVTTPHFLVQSASSQSWISHDAKVMRLEKCTRTRS